MPEVGLSGACVCARCASEGVCMWQMVLRRECASGTSENVYVLRMEGWERAGVPSCGCVSVHTCVPLRCASVLGREYVI